LLRRTLNLGILAHVDAGKTTLTERLLYAAGVIDAPGSVDAGTTQTDTLALERRRGITIRSAVVSFELGDVTVNLIDTPGHPDFIAEVERVLSVLDGAVLVVSAVEGVQPQTRILMRALRRLHLPTLVFVNKVDRAGADSERVTNEIRDRLGLAVVPMTAVDGDGARAASVRPLDEAALRPRLLDVLAERDDGLLSAYVDGESITPARLQAALAEQAGRALVHPVYAGSAITGAGVDALASGIATLLPAAVGDDEGPAAAVVFKIERGPGGDKIAYVRLFSGTLRTRERVCLGDSEDKVTAIGVFERGSVVTRPSVSGRAIAKLWGLRTARIGDRIGDVPLPPLRHEFAPPTLEAVVTPRDPGDATHLRDALMLLAEQDPLIDVRRGLDGELAVSLYGEVQKEVLQDTLAADHRLEISFGETMPICVERPVRRGEAVERLRAETNPYLATIGLRVEPADVDSGVAVRLDVDPRAAPLYVYRTFERFGEYMETYVRAGLDEGLHGWRVTDCTVTMTDCVYSVPDGPPSRRGPLSTPADFRKLTPIVLRRALEQSGTAVCEPMVRAVLEVPARTIGSVVAALVRLGAAVEPATARGELATVEAVLPVVRTNELQRQLPALTGGEGVVETSFAGYRPVSGRLSQPAPAPHVAARSDPPR